MNLFNFGIQVLGVNIWNVIMSFLSIFPKLAYLLCHAFLTLIDMMQFMFRKFAGLEVYYVEAADGTLVAEEGDVIYRFILNILMGDEFPLLTNVFWSLVVLGIILLFVSTIIAIIRKDYTYDEKSAKGPIIGKAFKGLAFMAMIPIIVLFGIYMNNVILKAVDTATSPQKANSFATLDTKYLEAYPTMGDTQTSYIAYNFFGARIGTNTTPFSAMIFNLGMHDANRVRLTEHEKIAVNFEIIGGGSGGEVNGVLGLINAGVYTDFGGLIGGSDDVEVVATQIDEAFMGSVQVKDQYAEALDYDSDYMGSLNFSFDPFKAYDAAGSLFGDGKYYCFDRGNVNMVFYYYDLWRFNLFLMLGAGIMIGVVFLNLSIAMLARIVELLALFMVYAPLIGLMPLDNEKAYNAWRGKFLGKVTMAFGAIGGMNILLILLPYLTSIKFFNNVVSDLIVQILLIFVGLNFVKGFMSMLSEFVGSEDAAKKGEEVGKDIGKQVLKAGVAAAGVAAIAAAPVAIGARAGLGAFNALKATKAANSAAGLAARKDAVYKSAKKNFLKTRKKEALEAEKYDAKAAKKEIDRDLLDKDVALEAEKASKGKWKDMSDREREQAMAETRTRMVNEREQARREAIYKKHGATEADAELYAKNEMKKVKKEGAGTYVKNAGKQAFVSSAPVLKAGFKAAKDYGNTIRDGTYRGSAIMQGVKEAGGSGKFVNAALDAATVAIAGTGAGKYMEKVSKFAKGTSTEVQDALKKIEAEHDAREIDTKNREKKTDAWKAKRQAEIIEDLEGIKKKVEDITNKFKRKP